MKKGGGIGIGSASIVLVFAVLCLTIFAIISYASAIADSTLVEVEAALLKSYYEADTLAESVFAEILAAESVPETVQGVEILYEWNFDIETMEDSETISYACPISEKKELYVVIAVNGGFFDIQTWRMRDVGEWETDDEPLNLWPGFDFDDEPLNLWPGG